MNKPKIQTSAFADFILFYKGKDGSVKQRKFEDTLQENVYRVARTLPQGITWRIRRMTTRV
ncbi:hypothetical protein J4N45_10105 [Vibrio sp. SCSIO 43140]|uniref:hypothetical protein n=1 Tax=Vibrio sp. SCSIO 43140 TaxID=2819100 RepID=UPI002075A08A|nr:hypothetical protein [Vibrio sp. SCSIO 43140]USD58882.1 hypothetical protein J4N45_10105 [Vibrio sp. SCSIO 43140]